MPVCGPVCRLPGPRCCWRPLRLPGNGDAPGPVRSVARPPSPRLGPGPVARPLAHDAVHADPVARADAGDARTERSSGAVGVPPRCSTRCPAARVHRQAGGSVRRSARPAARRSRLPGRSSPRNSWLLIPPEPAPASWTEPVSVLRRPGGLRRTTRSLGPGRRALPGTRHTFAKTKPQVKGDFERHRVIHEQTHKSPEFTRSSTARTQRCPQRTGCSSPVHGRRNRSRIDDRALGPVEWGSMCTDLAAIIIIS
jgi:hypothetical protein